VAPTIPSEVPSQIRAGDTVRFTRSYSDFPVADGWALHLSVAGAGKLDADASTSGSEFLFTLTPAVTQTLARGTYRWAITATLSGARYTAEEGVLAVLPDLENAEAGDLQSHDEQVLAMLEAEILARAGSDHTEYTVDGRSLKREEITVLNAWADRVRARLARKRRGTLRMAAGQFVKPGAGQ